MGELTIRSDSCYMIHARKARKKEQVEVRECAMGGGEGQKEQIK